MFATLVPTRLIKPMSLGLLLSCLVACGTPDADASRLQESLDKVDARTLVSLKNAMRTRLMQRSLSTPSRSMDLEMDYRPVEDPAALVDMGEALERNLIALDAAGLVRGKVAGEPWSDFYWPTAGGLLGHRYADPAFPGGNDWRTKYDYVSRHSAESILAASSVAGINALSPSEKYDILIGDAEKPLTTAMWNEGRELQERDGRIPGWVGICDGWAAASIMAPRPHRAVTFRASTGQEITLYPSDVKALVSLLWARSNAPVRHMGGRCNDVYPDRDGSGRLQTQACMDTNPGAFHLAVVNQIGTARRSLIMDSAYDYQVWNQPILSYSYTYFNPRTGRSTATLQEAMVSLPSFPEDRFKSYRSPVTHHVVGVVMELVYLNETHPAPNLNDSPASDAKVRIEYRYDLELDADGNVIGGEWHQNKHPDFLWVPVPDATVSSIGEPYLQGEWNLPEQTPSPWAIPLRVSAQKSRPAARIVHALLERASAP